MIFTAAVVVRRPFASENVVVVVIETQKKSNPSTVTATERPNTIAGRQQPATEKTCFFKTYACILIWVELKSPNIDALRFGNFVFVRRCLSSSSS